MDTAVTAGRSGRTDNQSTQSDSPLHTDYRAYIDGLRAVAVLSVVGFHASPRQIHGGFVGVDIFFVISGFLISGIIYNALRKDQFSYLEFYIRRVRRIFPALLAVLCVCLIGGWFLLLPDEYRQLGRQVWAGAGFASNILFWTQAGYFDSDAAIKPLLHLWSLGVEEQFYLLWPLLLAFLYRRTRYLGLLIGALLLVSFVCNVAWVHEYPDATFYLPLARFWELLGGALLAYHLTVRRVQILQPLLRGGVPVEMLSLVGLALIVAALLLLRADSVFPGWWALLPTVGTMLIIATSGSWLNRVVLSNRVLVFVGLISYPLYLWHWVLLAIVRMRLYEDGAEAPRWQRVAAVALSFLLAWLTYELIERPIRFGPASRAKPIFLTLLTAMAVVGGCGVALDWSNGAAWRYPPAIRPLAAFDYDRERAFYGAALGGKTCFVESGTPHFDELGARCIDPPAPGKRLLVLWGDSHAASLYMGLEALQAQGRSIRIGKFTLHSCLPMLGRQFEYSPACAAFNEAAFENVRRLQPDMVVLEGDWWLYAPRDGSQMDLSGLQLTIRRLQQAGVSRIVVFGNLPVWQTAQVRVSMKVWLDTLKVPVRTNEYLVPGSLKVDAMVRQAVAGTGAIFISPIDTLCRQDGCLLTTDSSRWQPVAWDAAHLTRSGSVYLVTRVADEILGTTDTVRPAPADAIQ
jgi:peptidoglycan/LPS O-acetylase OafA/YrhL